jgi:cytoskeletal protein CcmA (bactofilin family)
MTHRDITGIGEINALLGKGTDFSGKLMFEGRVRLDGAFTGEIYSEGVLILGDGADVRAEIDVGTLVVRGGTLRGNVRARELVEVHAPGKVYGNIHAPQLFIDKGVVFEGQCTMTDEPEADALPLAAQPVNFAE